MLPLIGADHLRFFNWASSELSIKFPDTLEGKFQGKVVSVLIVKLKASLLTAERPPSILFFATADLVLAGSFEGQGSRCEVYGANSAMAGGAAAT